MSKDYEVGYGKPPESTQFKRGQSGNPKGRPKGQKNFKTVVRKLTQEKISITRDGRRISISRQEAAMLKLIEKALKGDARSLIKLLELTAIYNAEDNLASSPDLNEADQDILRRHLQDLDLQQAGTLMTDVSGGGASYQEAEEVDDGEI
jgi:hypothetical protein